MDNETRVSFVQLYIHKINWRLKLVEKKGTCGCGSIEYVLNCEVMNIVNCHCNMCKRHNGTSFSTYAVLPCKDLEITKGNNLISRYIAGTGQKHFCKTCGTPIYNSNEKYPGACMVFLGTLKSPESYVPKVNVWCESKLPWVDHLAEIPGLEQGV